MVFEISDNTQNPSMSVIAMLQQSSASQHVLSPCSA